jgi:hypothetical protein
MHVLLTTLHHPWADPWKQQSALFSFEHAAPNSAWQHVPF